MIQNLIEMNKLEKLEIYKRIFQKVIYMKLGNSINLIH